MINQEDIYKYIQGEDWTTLVDLLYDNKSDITSDTLLNSAARTFENEFLRKVSNYPVDNGEICENLETLYILDKGRFYTLDRGNHKKLIVELVKRKDLIEAYNYAKEYPDEDVCKQTIDNYEKTNSQKN